MGTRIAFVACAFFGCTGSTINPIAIQLHDRGIGYLNLAVEASDDVETRRICDRAEQTCRLALEYAPGFAHPYNCLGLIELQCHRRHEEAARSCRETIACADRTQDHRFRGMKEECVALLRRISE
jgi:hypothetical protein